MGYIFCHCCNEKDGIGVDAIVLSTLLPLRHSCTRYTLLKLSLEALQLSVSFLCPWRREKGDERPSYLFLSPSYVALQYNTMRGAKTEGRKESTDGLTESRGVSSIPKTSLPLPLLLPLYLSLSSSLSTSPSPPLPHLSQTLYRSLPSLLSK